MQSGNEREATETEETVLEADLIMESGGINESQLEGHLKPRG